MFLHNVINAITGKPRDRKELNIMDEYSLFLGKYGKRYDNAVLIMTISTMVWRPRMWWKTIVSSKVSFNPLAIYTIIWIMAATMRKKQKNIISWILKSKELEMQLKPCLSKLGIFRFLILRKVSFPCPICRSVKSTHSCKPKLLEVMCQATIKYTSFKSTGILSNGHLFISRDLLSSMTSLITMQ